MPYSAIVKQRSTGGDVLICIYETDADGTSETRITPALLPVRGRVMRFISVSYTGGVTVNPWLGNETGATAESVIVDEYTATLVEVDYGPGGKCYMQHISAGFPPSGLYHRARASALAVVKTFYYIKDGW